MFRIVAFFLLVFSTLSLSAQFWLEDFGTDPGCGITEADNYATSNGVWTVQAIGTNGIAAHNWYIGAQEAEMELNECGDSCMDDGDLEENTLYVSNGDFNAAYGAVFQNNADSETHLRAVSPVVSFAGILDTMALRIKYIYSGHPSSTCVLEYYDGTNWFDLWDIEETTGSCGDAGQWSEETLILPSSILGNPLVQFGIRWENTGPDEMPFPELSFALGEMECTCLPDITNEYPDPFDALALENPEVIINSDGCSNSITEIYYLAPWVAAQTGQSTATLSCTAPANDECLIEGVLIELDMPGCANGYAFWVGDGNSYSGPWIDGGVGWGEVSLTEEEICAGSCVDFTYITGIWSEIAEITMTMDVPGGTATFQQDPWDPNVIYGQICYDSPGTYEVTGHAEVCGFTEEVPAYWSITVLPTDIVPEITVSTDEICTNEYVTFNLVDMPGADVFWNFEGGAPSTSSTQFSGAIYYDTPGTYGVTVTTNSADGCGFGEFEETVTVIDCGEPPVAAFSVPTTTVCVGECIQFMDESTGTNNDTWSWAFGGGTPGLSSDQNPTVCYNAPGVYPVALTVGNMAGSDLSFNPSYIEVIECPAPLAAFSTSSTEICIGECIDFTDESTGSNINGWSWTFDGATIGNSDEQNPSGICYDTPGTYSVTLIVSNPNGSDEVTESTMVVVDPCYPDPVPGFSVDVETICPGECVSFTNTSTVTGDAEWNWSFAGANPPTSDEESPQGVCYSEPGTYSVTLTVTDLGGTESLTQNNLITVEDCPAPNAMFSVSNSVICPGECVQLNNLSTGIVTGYTWAFPDSILGDTAATNPELCFNLPGSYSISLTAYNDDGETSEYTLEQAVIVDPCLPEISIEVSEDRICVGDCVSFTNVSEVPSSNWLWTFPGAVNPTSQAENPAQVCYHTPGIFEVTLQADFGSVTADSTFSQIVHVIDSCGPVAGFNYTPIVCLGQCYHFENTSTGGSEYFWIFEGAAPLTSEDENPAEVCYLEETGLFNIVLTVTNDFGSSTSIAQQITVVNPPGVNAGFDQTIIQGTTTMLSATAGNGTGQYIWQPFEDVTCFSCPTTSTYPLNETTSFVVYYEQPGGCQSSDTITVFVEESYAFGVPGSFSPNGDGINDVLYVRGSNITKLDFQVYNRYGQEVFRTNNQKEGWDGTHNGRELNAGVFGYSLEVHQSDGTRTVLKGDVSIVR